MLANREKSFASSRSGSATVGRDRIGHESPRTSASGPAANDAQPSHDITQQTVSEAGAVPPLFSRLELLVIGIGERDPLSLITNSRWARLRRLLFGIEVPRSFADGRLEALRSLTVALRRRRSPHAALEAAIAAGVTLDQIEYLRSRKEPDGWSSQ